MYNDYELLYLAKENNEVAIKILYDKYYPVLCIKARIYSRIINSSYEELFQEANFAFYLAIDRYQDNTRFVTYLNKCLDSVLINYNKSYCRNKNKVLNNYISFDCVDYNVLIDNDNNPETILMEEYNYSLLKSRIIDSLSWNEELVFVLKEQNYTTKEIAEITDKSLKSVYNIIGRIKRKIEIIMSN